MKAKYLFGFTYITFKFCLVYIAIWYSFCLVLELHGFSVRPWNTESLCQGMETLKIPETYAISSFPTIIVSTATPSAAATGGAAGANLLCGASFLSPTITSCDVELPVRHCVRCKLPASAFSSTLSFHPISAGCAFLRRKRRFLCPNEKGRKWFQECWKSKGCEKFKQ